MQSFVLNGREFIVERGTDGFWYYRHSYEQAFGKKVRLVGDKLLVWNPGFAKFNVDPAGLPGGEAGDEVSFNNLGSVALYTKNGVSGEYEYTTMFDLFDHFADDATINIRDGLNFGASFDIIDNKLFIGCPNMDILDGDEEVVSQNINLGAVYVFSLITYDLVQTIVPDNTQGSYENAGVTFFVNRTHNFGYAMAAGDDYLVIGAPGYSTSVGLSKVNNSGRAYVYTKNGSDYELAFTFTPNTEVDGNRFGNYVDVDGDYVIVGSAPSSGASQSGYVKHYKMNAARTDVTEETTISNTHIGTSCGLRVNGSTVAIGTPYDDTVKIHTAQDGISSLTHTISDPLTKSFEVGRDIEFDDEYVIAGCPNGYRKLGIVLRFTNIGPKYTLV